jgi:hypothetical protein
MRTGIGVSNRTLANRKHSYAPATSRLVRALALHWLMLAAVMTACAGTSATPSRVEEAPAQDVSATEGVEFTLRTGGSGRLTNPPMVLRFERVESDSRCPVDTTCIWAGDALVRLSLEASNQRESAVLHTNADLERSVAFQGHRITLVKLMPLPRDGKRIQQSEYEATFVIVGV